MNIIDQNSTRIDALEKRLDKYDDIINELRNLTIELKTRADTNFKWLTGLVGICCAITGTLVGHFIH